eukprot:COSAG02_NODE_35242_length_471_cov_1.120968_2_plen_54_part_01
MLQCSPQRRYVGVSGGTICGCRGGQAQRYFAGDEANILLCPVKSEQVDQKTLDS